MTVRLYDTMTRTLRDFEPVLPGRVSIYLCGATVQSAPHVGHVRSSLAFDVVRRWFDYRGYDVTFLRNVTDIDDKVLAKSADAGVPWWAWAAQNERLFDDAYTALGCLPPTLGPRATGHITEMIELMQRLIDSGHAYACDGDVYFDVASFQGYGRLSGQKLDQMHAAGDSVGDSRKRDLRDFALWKAAKPGEPSWPTPWGRGRPGWHLECSAMAGAYLGDEFDIHGGGIDLIFPHHENEIAQSVSDGQRFARYWMHNAWVTAAGEKMSKSLGNGLAVTEVIERWRPVELRYYLASAHYRSTIEFSEAALADAAAAYRRIEGFVERAGEVTIPIAETTTVPAEFAAHMDDDFGVAGALGVLHAVVRRGNNALVDGDEAAATEALTDVFAMTAALGLDPRAWSEPTPGTDIGAVLDLILDQREQARARRDFVAADQIRKQLTSAGIEVEDTAAGPRWSLRRTPDVDTGSRT